VDLVPSSRTVSGFKWSSPKGPPLVMQSGTICSAQIIERKQPPITLVIPVIKKFFGV